MQYAIRVDTRYSDEAEWREWCYSEIGFTTRKDAKTAINTIIHNATANGHAVYTKGTGDFTGMHMVKNAYVTRIYTIVNMEG